MILVVLKAPMRAKYVDEFPAFIAEFAERDTRRTRQHLLRLVPQHRRPEHVRAAWRRSSTARPATCTSRPSTSRRRWATSAASSPPSPRSSTSRCPRAGRRCRRSSAASVTPARARGRGARPRSRRGSLPRRVDEPTTGSIRSACSAASREPSNAASATSCWIGDFVAQRRGEREREVVGAIADDPCRRGQPRSPRPRSRAGNARDEIVVGQDRRRDALRLAGDRGAQDRAQRLVVSHCQNRSRSIVPAMIASTTSSIMRRIFCWRAEEVVRRRVLDRLAVVLPRVAVARRDHHAELRRGGSARTRSVSPSPSASVRPRRAARR